MAVGVGFSLNIESTIIAAIADTQKTANISLHVEIEFRSERVKREQRHGPGVTRFASVTTPRTSHWLLPYSTAGLRQVEIDLRWFKKRIFRVADED